MSNAFQNEQERIEFDTVAGLAEDIVLRLPGCTDVMIRKAIQSVYRDFAKGSCVFRTVRRVPVVGNGCRFAPSLSEMYVDSVVSVRLNGKELFPRREYEVVDNCEIHIFGVPDYDMGDGDEALRFIVDAAGVPPGDFKKFGPPTLEIVCIEVPRVGSESAPKWFLEKYSEAIVSGTIARLMLMTGKPWSDPEQAKSERVCYDNLMSEARSRYVGNGQFGNGDSGYGVDTRVVV